MTKLIGKIKALLEKRPELKELILYGIFGALTTLVNWVVYLLITEAFGLNGYDKASRAYYLISNAGQILGWILSVLFAYATNKKFVFQSKADRKTGAWKEFWLFVSARISSLLIFDLLLFNILLAAGLNDKWDKLLMNVLVIIFNYVASRFVIFKKKKDGQD